MQDGTVVGTGNTVVLVVVDVGHGGKVVLVGATVVPGLQGTVV